MASSDQSTPPRVMDWRREKKLVRKLLLARGWRSKSACWHAKHNRWGML